MSDKINAPMVVSDSGKDSILNSEALDVAVVGGGPAGVSACLELSRQAGLKIALFESDTELGGIPRSCHIFFGMRDMWRLYTGPAYARKLASLIRKTSVQIHTDSTVLSIDADPEGNRHCLQVATSGGLRHYHCRFIILATGCCERSRGARLIPGTRPEGVYTTGALQKIVHQGGFKPGKKAVIIGSEIVSLSCALTLKKAGVSIKALVEENRDLSTYRLAAGSLSFAFGFHVYVGTSVARILGNRRVEGIELLDTTTGKTFQIDCDTVVFTGKFRPEESLIFNTEIKEDSAGPGPVVDTNFMTSVPNIFAAGNILHGAEMHDICALEGKSAAENILNAVKTGKAAASKYLALKAHYPVRYVVPQRIPLDIGVDNRNVQPKGKLNLQLACTMRNSVLEAWSGTELLWSRKYRRVIGNNRIVIPIEKLNWKLIDPEKGIDIKIASAA